MMSITWFSEATAHECRPPSKAPRTAVAKSRLLFVAMVLESLKSTCTKTSFRIVTLGPRGQAPGPEARRSLRQGAQIRGATRGFAGPPCGLRRAMIPTPKHEIARSDVGCEPLLLLELLLAGDPSAKTTTFVRWKINCLIKAVQRSNPMVI